MKIEIPKGYTIDLEKSNLEKGEIFFKKEKLEFTSLGEIEGYFIDNCSEIQFSKGHALFHTRNTWPSKEEAEAALALSQLCQWRNKYNEGWVPNWEDDTKKYQIFYFGNEISFDWTYHSINTLSFKSIEIRDKFYEDFKELIEIAKPLL